MKKTLIALLALGCAAVASAAFDPAQVNVYNPTFIDGSITSTTDQGIEFGSVTPLTSWMLEFSMTNPGSGPNKASICTYKDGNKNLGITLLSWGANASQRPVCIALRQANGNYDTTHGNLQFDLSGEKSATMRLAYDAANDVAYLYDVDGERSLTFDAISTSLLDIEGESKDHLSFTSGVSGMRNFGESVTLIKLYDLSKAVSQGEVEKLAFAQFVADPTVPVPEPTTGSLSLLALAGLCVRRRKK